MLRESYFLTVGHQQICSTVKAVGNAVLTLAPWDLSHSRAQEDDIFLLGKTRVIAVAAGLTYRGNPRTELVIGYLARLAGNILG